jgi:hypothetical protein
LPILLKTLLHMHPTMDGRTKTLQKVQVLSIYDIGITTSQNSSTEMCKINTT